MLTKQVHKYATNPSTGVSTLLETIPYVRLSQNDEVVYLQRGGCYGESNEPCPEPAWLEASLERLSAATRASVGFGALPEEETQEQLFTPQVVTCDECHETIEQETIGTHMLRHRKKRGA